MVNKMLNFVAVIDILITIGVAISASVLTYTYGSIRKRETWLLQNPTKTLTNRKVYLRSQDGAFSSRIKEILDQQIVKKSAIANIYVSYSTSNDEPRGVEIKISFAYLLENTDTVKHTHRIKAEKIRQIKSELDVKVYQIQVDGKIVDREIDETSKGLFEENIVIEPKSTSSVIEDFSVFGTIPFKLNFVQSNLVESGFRFYLNSFVKENVSFNVTGQKSMLFQEIADSRGRVWAYVLPDPMLRDDSVVITVESDEIKEYRIYI